jgi:uncharacterized 2Fe-2S/4Fe-4S cluster protein (DUF4445 family)
MRIPYNVNGRVDGRGYWQQDEMDSLVKKIDVVELSNAANFEKIFVKAMSF